MVSNHRLAQRILDSGWGTFERFLKYKTCVVLVAPNNTTVDCSRCGSAVPKVLGVRTHRCYVCSLVLDRDYNAAINILQKGMGILGMHESTAGTAGTYACRDLAEVIEAGRGYGLVL